QAEPELDSEHGIRREAGLVSDKRVVTNPRPGHADLAGAIKYRHKDLRNVLERSSARETAARVAVGSVARRLLEELGIGITGQVIAIGDVQAAKEDIDNDVLNSRLADSRLKCADPLAEQRMVAAIDRAKEAGDTLGGVFEIAVHGVPAGLGSYAHWDRKLDSRLAAAVISIQAVKGVEFGAGFALSGQPGSKTHDEIYYNKNKGFFRRTNHAGGLEGGMSNGEVLLLRVAMKPIPTLYQPLRSVNFFTKEEVLAAVERSDTCAVPAACVIGEAVVAWEIAVACLEKCGGDSLAEIKENWLNYLNHLRQV
ncbi:MAG: chorismate synthase, partial [Peptococcaceae bacterium]|nr:chorismate synthase [Peptococcaceae bacterium]